jgi:hypothetical protein
MSKADQLLDVLQPAWIKAGGDINAYMIQVWSLLRDLQSDEDKRLLIQLAIAAAQLPARKQEEGALIVESIVSGRDREPYVRLQFKKELIQLSAEDARQHACQVMTVAAAAESDAFLFHYLESLGIDDHISGNVLVEFRNFRKRKTQ